MLNKFKVGDKVLIEISSGSEGGFPMDLLAKVKEVLSETNGNYMYRVSCIDCPVSEEQMTTYVEPDPNNLRSCHG